MAFPSPFPGVCIQLCGPADPLLSSLSGLWATELFVASLCMGQSVSPIYKQGRQTFSGLFLSLIFTASPTGLIARSGSVREGGTLQLHQFIFQFLSLALLISSGVPSVPAPSRVHSGSHNLLRGHPALTKSSRVFVGEEVRDGMLSLS